MKMKKMLSVVMACMMFAGMTTAVTADAAFKKKGTVTDAITQAMDIAAKTAAEIAVKQIEKPTSCTWPLVDTRDDNGHVYMYDEISWEYDSNDRLTNIQIEQNADELPMGSHAAGWRVTKNKNGSAIVKSTYTTRNLASDVIEAVSKADLPDIAKDVAVHSEYARTIWYKIDASTGLVTKHASAGEYRLVNGKGKIVLAFPLD